MEVLNFVYDGNGVLYAMTRTVDSASPDTYYYITNLQGDVMYLVDETSETVAAYAYDPYGQITFTEGDLATVNPLRYRGYYSDDETGFYYLQSRYYDPAVCRFISGDSYACTGQGFLGNNMFSYCNNTPVSTLDSEGNRPNTALMVTDSGSGGDVIDTTFEGEGSEELYNNYVLKDIANGVIDGNPTSVTVTRGEECTIDTWSKIQEAGVDAVNAGILCAELDLLIDPASKLGSALIGIASSIIYSTIKIANSTNLPNGEYTYYYVSVQSHGIAGKQPFECYTNLVYACMIDRYGSMQCYLLTEETRVYYSYPNAHYYGT